MKTVSEKTLKSRMSELFHEIEATGEELLVAENGEMVLKIISYRRDQGIAEPPANQNDVSS